MLNISIERAIGREALERQTQNAQTTQKDAEEQLRQLPFLRLQRVQRGLRLLGFAASRQSGFSTGDDRDSSTPRLRALCSE